MPRRTPLEVYIAQTTDRSLRYEARMRKAGLTKACVWVPTHCVDALKETAEKWRDAHEKARAADPATPP